MIDQLYHWSIIEAGDAGFRNFGLPMTVDPVYAITDGAQGSLWGFNVGMFKDGVKLTTIGISFDETSAQKSEWVGRDENGFPTNEGSVEEVKGKQLEIW